MTGWLAQFDEEFERDPNYLAQLQAMRVVEQALGIMERKGISRAELATMMGVSKPYISRTLNAPPNLTLRTIAELANALGAKLRIDLVEEAPAAAEIPLTESNIA